MVFASAIIGLAGAVLSSSQMPMGRYGGKSGLRMGNRAGFGYGGELRLSRDMMGKTQVEDMAFARTGWGRYRPAAWS